jgi:hypothetical protein
MAHVQNMTESQPHFFGQKTKHVFIFKSKWKIVMNGKKVESYELGVLNKTKTKKVIQVYSKNVHFMINLSFLVRMDSTTFTFLRLSG